MLSFSVALPSLRRNSPDNVEEKCYQGGVLSASAACFISRIQRRVASLDACFNCRDTSCIYPASRAFEFISINQGGLLREPVVDLRNLIHTVSYQTNTLMNPTLEKGKNGSWAMNCELLSARVYPFIVSSCIYYSIEMLVVVAYTQQLFSLANYNHSAIFKGPIKHL